MNTYDYLIVLCASSFTPEGKFLDMSDDGLYVGGQLRMHAAAIAYQRKPGNVIVVGGGMESADPTEKWRKVTDMARYLVENDVNATDILAVASEPDTLGNMRALYTTCKQRLAGKRAGILTNGYHLPRAVRIANDQQFDWDTHFVPVSAEDLLPNDPYWNEQYSDGLTARIAAEQKGLAEWEKGSYNRQDINNSEWVGEFKSGTEVLG